MVIKCATTSINSKLVKDPRKYSYLWDKPLSRRNVIFYLWDLRPRSIITADPRKPRMRPILSPAHEAFLEGLWPLET